MLALMSGADPKALRAGSAELPAPRALVDDPTESELQEIIAATYQQLIDRVPFDSERLAGGRSPVAFWVNWSGRLRGPGRR